MVNHSLLNINMGNHSLLSTKMANHNTVNSHIDGHSLFGNCQVEQVTPETSKTDSGLGPKSILSIVLELDNHSWSSTAHQSVLDVSSEGSRNKSCQETKCCLDWGRSVENLWRKDILKFYDVCSLFTVNCLLNTICINHKLEAFKSEEISCQHMLSSSILYLDVTILPQSAHLGISA